jgi:hypothetical protein
MQIWYTQFRAFVLMKVLDLLCYNTLVLLLLTNYGATSTLGSYHSFSPKISHDMGNPKFHYYIRKNLWIIRVLGRIQPTPLASFFEICFINPLLSTPRSLRSFLFCIAPDENSVCIYVFHAYYVSLPWQCICVMIITVWHRKYKVRGS